MLKQVDKIDIFLELNNKIWNSIFLNNFSEIKISNLNYKIIDEIKALKVIEIDNLESFNLYLSYDHYLIFKFNKEYYFCDTELSSTSNCKFSMVKIIDYNIIFRKDKINKINLLN